MDISYDLLIEILKWLPVKSLLRLRSVSKSWLRIIDDDHFINTHAAVSRFSNVRLLCINLHPFQIISVNQFSDKSLLLGQFPEHIDTEVTGVLEPSQCFIYFVGSCNGIVCYLQLLVPFHTRCFLWNPSTREIKQLIDPVKGTDGDYKYGFGFDESSGDHKVVVIKDKQTYLYSLRSDSWKRISSLDEDGWLFRSSIYLKGKLYWIRLKNNFMFELVCFDLATETYRNQTIGFPMDYDIMAGNVPDVNIFKDRIYVQRRVTESETDIWFLNEATSYWDGPHQIRIQEQASEDSTELCARVTNNGIIEVAGMDFLISLDGSISSDNMMIIKSPYNFIPLLKVSVSLVPLSRSKLLIESPIN